MKIEVSIPSTIRKKISGGNACPQHGVYDCSALIEFMRCPHSYYLTYEKGLSPLSPHKALDFGERFHKALFHYYNGVDMEEAVDRAFEGYDPEGDTKRTSERARALLIGYRDKYQDKEDWQILHNEVSFAVDMPNETLFRGRIDLIVELQGGIYIVDHKTSSYGIGYSFLNNFHPHFQMDGYAYACYALLGRCDGVIVNGISVAANPKVRYGRGPTPRSTQELLDWEQNYEICVRLIEWSRENGWLHSTLNCNDYGGCKFKDLCLYGIPEKDWPSMFNVDPGCNCPQDNERSEEDGEV